MKHKATIIFYEVVKQGADAKRLMRIQRLIRRENLPAIGEKVEHIPGRLDALSDTHQASSLPAEALPLLPESRYLVTFEVADPKRLHALISSLRAFAEYCGINSRLFSWTTE